MLARLRPPQARQVRVVERAADRFRERVRVARRHEEHPLAERGDLLRAALARAPDRGHAASERLDVGNAERLVDARHRHDVARGELLEGGVWRELARELDSALQVRLVYER